MSEDKKLVKVKALKNHYAAGVGFIHHGDTAMVEEWEQKEFSDRLIPITEPEKPEPKDQGGETVEGFDTTDEAAKALMKLNIPDLIERLKEGLPQDVVDYIMANDKRQGIKDYFGEE